MTIEQETSTSTVITSAVANTTSITTTSSTGVEIRNTDTISGGSPLTQPTLTQTNQTVLTSRSVTTRSSSRSRRSESSEQEDVFMAVEALGKLKNSVTPPPVSESSSSSSQTPQQPPLVDNLLTKVTSHPLISNSIRMIEDNKRRWFHEEPQKLQNLKELGIANFNIESRRKLQMLINFLKLGNKQLNKRVEYLSEICEEEKLKRSSVSHVSEKNPDIDPESESEGEEDYHDAHERHSTKASTPAPSTTSHNHPDIKSEIVGTVKKIVKVVSKFTGNSLPEPARTHVRELLLKLPNNWALLQKEMMISSKNDYDDQTSSDPNFKVLLLAQESLEMIKKILNLCNENLSSLENWNHLKVEEQKFLKEKILHHNQHRVLEENEEEEEEEEEEIARKKRVKIGIDDLVNNTNNTSSK